MIFTFDNVSPHPQKQKTLLPASAEDIRLPELSIVTDGSLFKGKVWREMAMQIYCEHGTDRYREIGHYGSGAPFLYDEDIRISISHTAGCLVVASLEIPSGRDLSAFSPDIALGVDVERADRDKALKLRERFLTPEELSVIKAESVEENILAWSCKEAMLKATMDSGIDWRNHLTILRLPAPLSEKEYISGHIPPAKVGVGTATPQFHSAPTPLTFNLISLRYQDFFIVLAL